MDKTHDTEDRKTVRRFDVNKKRLQMVIKVLEKVPVKRFYLWSWFDKSYGECGSTACAIGWCAQDKRFVEEGLTLQRGEPIYECFYGWDAVEEFFELTERQASRLFNESGYKDLAHDPKPKDVIKKIRHFIKTGEC